jgi:hypothetical protein
MPILSADPSKVSLTQKQLKLVNLFPSFVGHEISAGAHIFPCLRDAVSERAPRIIEQKPNDIALSRVLEPLVKPLLIAGNLDQSGPQELNVGKIQQ